MYGKYRRQPNDLVIKAQSIQTKSTRRKKLLKRPHTSQGLRKSPSGKKGLKRVPSARSEYRKSLRSYRERRLNEPVRKRRNYTSRENGSPPKTNKLFTSSSANFSEEKKRKKDNFMKSESPKRDIGNSIDARKYSSNKNVSNKSKLKKNEIEIHVYDQGNKRSKVFVCRKDLLLREMKYFEIYFNNTNYSFDDIDISVHCDVNIFQWLMDYILYIDSKSDSVSPRKEVLQMKEPKLEISWAVSILISSDFLKMKRLMKKALLFVHDHFQEIILLPIDLDCINSKLLSSLCELFNMDELERIKDKRDKIMSKMYLMKLEELLLTARKNNVSNYLCRCKNCFKIFSNKMKSHLHCTGGKKTKNVFINEFGKVNSVHVIDPFWDINKYLSSLSLRNHSWKRIYWHIWGLIHHFFCDRCQKYFPAVEIENCSYHPKDPIYKPYTNVGMYPCCNKKTYRFDSVGRVCEGCRPRSHLVTTNEHTTRIENLTILLNKKKLIMSPNVGMGSKSDSSCKQKTFPLYFDNSKTNITNQNTDKKKSSKDSYQNELLKSSKFKECFGYEKYFKYCIFENYNNDLENTKRRKEIESGILSKKELEDKGLRLNSGMEKVKLKKKKRQNYKALPKRKRFFVLDKQRFKDEENVKVLNEVVKMYQSLQNVGKGSSKVSHKDGDGGTGRLSKIKKKSSAKSMRRRKKLHPFS